MPNIRVDIPSPIVNGQTLTFKSPADCSQVTGLVVYYPVGGSESSITFQFADSHGNNVGDIDHLFTEGVLVKVILDTEQSKAYVQNADTNSYLEENAMFRNKEWILSPKQFGDSLPDDAVPGRIFFVKAPRA